MLFLIGKNKTVLAQNVLYLLAEVIDETWSLLILEESQMKNGE